MKAISTLWVILSFYGVSFSQSNNSYKIDFNNISGQINNNGSFFNRQGLNAAGYFVPKSDSATTIYQMNVWMSALDVNNVPHMITRTYLPAYDPQIGDYIAGPWSTTGQYQDQNYMNQYFNSLWKVSKSEIDAHIANYNNVNYVIPASIENWPGNGDVSLGVSQQLAPFVDLNGNGIYEPILGEYPDIPGGQAVYLIMTDRNSYPNAGLGLEMHFMFYQKNNNLILDNTTFLNINIINKSTMQYHDFRMTFYLDPDIGGASDDFIGCDTTLNMIYAYNGDSFDDNENGFTGYGTNPPAQNVMSLNHKMESAIFYNNGSSYPFSDPTTYAEYWNIINGLWQDGSSIGYGGAGFFVDSLHPPTTFLFPGDPVTGLGWSEVNTEPITNPGTAIPPGDRRMLMTIALGDLGYFESKCADFAFVTSFSGGDYLANVTSLKNASTYIQELYDADESFPCRRFYLGTNEIYEQGFTVFPNPSNGNFKIEFSHALEGATIEVRALTGELIYKEKAKGYYHHVSIDGREGIYFVTVYSPKGKITKRMIVQ